MKRISLLLGLFLSTALAGAQGPAGPQAPAVDPNTVAPGELLVEPPTLINLGFEWFVEGDENRNAAVAVAYRRSGESTWTQALPLLRLKGERIYSQSQVDVIAPNRFAGSVLDLQPDTSYDVQFVLTDPEGVRGESRRTLTLRTRPEPKPYAGGRWRRSPRGTSPACGSSGPCGRETSARISRRRSSTTA